MKKALLAVLGLGLAAALIYFFFAPVFRGEIIIQPELRIGGFAIRYYGLILAAAVLVGYGVARTNAWRYGLGKDEVDRLIFWALLVAFLSARLYFVIFDFQYFSVHPYEILSIWNGGLSFFGAMIGGLVFILVFVRKRAYSVWQVLDMLALALPLSQAIGRFGNFFNYEAYGSATSLPWKMFIPDGYRYAGLEQESFYHPTFLYEAAGNLIIFFILYSLRGRMRSGNLALVYLASYGLLRAAVEFFRLDSVVIGSVKVDQAVAGVICAASIVFLLYRFIGQKQLEKKA